MTENIIIYDTINSGKNWQNDLLNRCKVYENVCKVVIFGIRNRTTITFNDDLDQMLNTPGKINIVTVSPDSDVAVEIGAYIYDIFNSGLFPDNSIIRIVTPSESVVSAIKLATAIIDKHDISSTLALKVYKVNVSVPHNNIVGDKSVMISKLPTCSSEDQ